MRTDGARELEFPSLFNKFGASYNLEGERGRERERDAADLLSMCRCIVAWHLDGVVQIKEGMHELEHFIAEFLSYFYPYHQGF